MIKPKMTCLLVLLVSFSSQCWSANELPEYYPNHFQNEGVLQDIQRGKLIINATFYRLVENVPVHTLDTIYGSHNNLHKDMDIAFHLVDGNVISEIWILPKGYVELD